MKKAVTIILGALLVLVFSVPASDAFARHRPHVRIHKDVVVPQARPTHPIAHPVAALPVVGVVFDLVRRSSCDPAINHAYGPNDPGYPESGGAETGNFLLPAIYVPSRCPTVQPVAYYSDRSPPRKKHRKHRKHWRDY